jgi:hypothetical protein
MPVINGLSTNHENLIPPMLTGFSRAWKYQVNLLNTIVSDVGAMRGVKGETIKTNYAEDLSVTDVEPSLTLPAGERPQYYDVTIELQHWKKVRFELPDREIADGIGRTIIPQTIQTAASNMADHMNQAILSEIKSTGNVITTTGTPVSSYADVVAMNKLLSMRAPVPNRMMVFGRDSEANLLVLPQFLEDNFHAPAGTIMNGVIGRKLGFDFMPVNTNNNDLVSEVSGDVTFTVGEFKPNRDSTVVATTAGTGTFNVGNILVAQSINGTDVTTQPIDKRILTVSKSGLVAGGSATINVRAGHDFIEYTNGATIVAKLLKIQDEGFAYQKNACVLVMRPSETLGFADGRGTVYDKGNNISYTLEKERAHKITLFTLDMLYGIHTVKPDFAVRHVKFDAADQYV